MGVGHTQWICHLLTATVAPESWILGSLSENKESSHLSAPHPVSPLHKGVLRHEDRVQESKGTQLAYADINDPKC